MDYLKIVLDGYCDVNSRNHLVDYFKREALIAKENHYSFEEFFDGCKNAVVNLQEYYHHYLHKEKWGFYNANASARIREIKIQENFFETWGFPEYDKKSYEEQCDKLIEINNEYVKGLNLNRYSQPLHYLNMGYSGHLSYNDTEQISNAIILAKTHFKIDEFGKELIELITNSKSDNTPPPIQLTRTLKSTQQEYLFNKLIEKELFLPKNTNIESFCYVFGGCVKPDNFEALEWRHNMQTLRELIVGLKNPNIKITTHQYPIPPYFKKDGKIIKHLPGNKEIKTTESKKIAEYIKNIATR